jgi:hypothetical protein
MPRGIYKRRQEVIDQMKDREITWGDKISKSKLGKKNGIWKGDNARTDTIHQWLSRNFGKANCCKNLNCAYPQNKVKRWDYALIHGKKYSHNINNFIMLCRSCHIKYDRNIKDIKII